MEQLRIGFPPRDPSNPISRFFFGLISVLLGLAAVAVVLFVAVPLAGIILSAAVGGMILALAGLVMMIPLILLTATVLALMTRTGERKSRTYGPRSYWR
jgi:hypothetical protein